MAVVMALRKPPLRCGAGKEGQTPDLFSLDGESSLSSRLLVSWSVHFVSVWVTFKASRSSFYARSSEQMLAHEVSRAVFVIMSEM